MTEASIHVQRWRENTTYAILTSNCQKIKLIVFTGVSGSGKSSLAIDTVYAEGQRRYIESLSAYARQFLGQLGKPDIDKIVGVISVYRHQSGINRT